MPSSKCSWCHGPTDGSYCCSDRCRALRLAEKARYRNGGVGLRTRAAYNVRMMLQSTDAALRDAVANMNGRTYAPSDGS